MLNCPNRKRGKAMKVNIRKWELADAKDRINFGEDQSAVEWTVSDIWERALELFSDIAAAGLLGLKSSKAATDE